MHVGRVALEVLQKLGAVHLEQKFDYYLNFVIISLGS